MGEPHENQQQNQLNKKSKLKLQQRYMNEIMADKKDINDNIF